VVRLGKFEKITLPVEVTDTDQSALMLASYPSMLSVDVCPFQPALIFAGRSEVPVPMVMVSCWVPVGPQICPDA
jgi:hypothetical protein